MLLEHHPQLALLRRYGDTGTGDDAVIEQDTARCGSQEPGDTAQQRRLPGSRRADESEELPVRDLQVDVGEADGTGAVSQRDVFECDGGHVHPFCYFVFGIANPMTASPSTATMSDHAAAVLNAPAC